MTTDQRIIKNYAEKGGYNVLEYELAAQFRCNGSNAFVNWVNNTLAIKKTANIFLDKETERFFKSRMEN
ncbi:MAG: DNA/RNA helicase domain-containing protein [Halanaerobiales bacterium]